MNLSLGYLGYKVFRIFTYLLLLISGYLLTTFNNWANYGHVNVWVGLLVIIIFSFAIVAEVYTEIRYITANKKEKQRMDKQKTGYSYYYNKWSYRTTRA